LTNPRANASVEILNKIGAMLPSGKKDAATKKSLTLAGYRSQHALPVFYGTRLVAIGITVLSAMVIPVSDSNPVMRMMLLIGAAGIGWRIPGFILKKKVTNRQERLKLALPDALDLIVVSVEAGLGLDQAIQYVAVELHNYNWSAWKCAQGCAAPMPCGVLRREPAKKRSNDW
jgi:tight adherence protein C